MQRTYLLTVLSAAFSDLQVWIDWRMLGNEMDLASIGPRPGSVIPPLIITTCC